MPRRSWWRPVTWFPLASGALISAFVIPAATNVSAQGVSRPWAQSQWAKSHGAAARLVGGRMVGAGGEGVQILAGVEIKLEDGWKTYWRNPGDAGGVPPSFNWSGSRNLKSAEPLNPAPIRIKDASGQNIGYKTHVVFPARITPLDPAEPVDLALRFEYGICREICVPAEARLSLTITPQNVSVPLDLIRALQRVPRPAGSERASGQPRLKAAKASLSGPTPKIDFEIAADSADDTSDLFVETPAGIYLPMANKLGAPVAGVQRYRIDLKGLDGNAALKGKALRLTMTGRGGAAETMWTVK